LCPAESIRDVRGSLTQLAADTTTGAAPVFTTITTPLQQHSHATPAVLPRCYGSLLLQLSCTYNTTILCSHSWHPTTTRTLTYDAALLCQLISTQKAAILAHLSPHRLLPLEPTTTSYLFPALKLLRVTPHLSAPYLCRYHHRLPLLAAYFAHK